MWTYTISGLVIGAVWAIIGSGLVVTYSTTRVLNLGFGGIAYALAEVFFNLRSSYGLDGVTATIVVVLGIAPMLAVALWWLVFRHLESAGIVPTLVATIGLAVAFPAAAQLFFQHPPVYVAPGILDNGSGIINIGVSHVTRNQATALAGSLAVGLLLTAFLRLTHTGLETRAVVDRRDVAQLMGVRTPAVGLLSWVIGVQLAALAGVLLAPVTQLDASAFLQMTVASLSVALAAGMSSIPVVYAAAVLLGVLSGVLTNYAGSFMSVGLDPLLSFAVIAVLLLARRSPIATASERISRRPTEKPRKRYGVGAVATVLIVVLPLVLSDYWTGLVAVGIIYAVLFLGFTVSIGDARILPLGQSAFAGLGAFGAGYAMTHASLPLLIAIPVGALFAGICGVVLFALGVKFGQLEFGLLTLAFAVLCDNMLFLQSSFVPLGGYSFPGTSLFGLIEIGSQRSIYYLAAVVFALGAVGILTLRRRVTGLEMRAVAQNLRAAQATGIPVRSYRAGAFAIGTVLAGLGGGLLGLYQQQVSPDDFLTFTGLFWLAVLVTMGRLSPIAALAGGIAYSIIPAIFSHFLSGRWDNMPALLFGLGGLALAQDSRGVVSQVRTVTNGLMETIAHRRVDKAPSLESDLTYEA
jgi:branched-chain amino acid transport system permease protein